MHSRHVLVSGKVQGVYFRFHAAEMARRLGLDGWVRNLPDGRVEALFAGDEKNVQAMLAWCRRGPSEARVDGIEVAEGAAVVAGSGFAIRY